MAGKLRVTRREFMLAGAAALTAPPILTALASEAKASEAVPAAAEAPSARTKQTYLETVIETDVLVIGGGMAGAFAAVKAREQGADVTLVSKGKVGRSGMTPWASSTFVVTPGWEEKIDAFMEKAHADGGYLTNRDWTRRVVEDSYARFQDLVSWGVPFPRDEAGNYQKLVLGETEFPAVWMTTDDAAGSWVSPLRDKPLALGVRLFEKVMVVDLLKQDGRGAFPPTG